MAEKHTKTCKSLPNPNFSAHISSFCNMVSQVKEDHKWNSDEVTRLDKLTQDYLHKLELEDLDYRERAKIATRLAKCRQLRRQSKDTTEILDPLMDFLESEKGRQMMNLMRETLGRMRKAEDRMSTRKYRYKVLDLEPIE